MIQVKYITRFAGDTGLSGASWLLVKEYEVISGDERYSTCEMEVVSSWRSLVPISQDIVDAKKSDDDDLNVEALRGCLRCPVLQKEAMCSIDEKKCVRQRKRTFRSMHSAHAHIFLTNGNHMHVKFPRRRTVFLDLKGRLPLTQSSWNNLRMV